MQTDTTPNTQSDYRLTAHNSQTHWIAALNSQITRAAARDSQIVGFAFYRQATHWLHFRIILY